MSPVFDFKLARHTFGPIDMAWFPGVENATGSSGSLVFNTNAYKPSQDGVLLYFTSVDVSNEIGKVENAGGKGASLKNSNLRRGRIYGSDHRFGRKPDCVAFIQIKMV